MSNWADPLSMLFEEYHQRRDEGVQIPAWIRRRIEQLSTQQDMWNAAAVDELWTALDRLPEDEALAAREPSNLPAIRAQRPDGPRDLGWAPSETELVERLHAAWTGRCVGCALGKPVEGMGMTWADGQLVGRARIKTYLTNRGDWPLTDYFSGRDVGDGLRLGCERSQREHIAYMEDDDDIHYSLVGLGVLEEHGPGFTWMDVARYWSSHIPFASICTAETQALLNFWNHTSRRQWKTTNVCQAEWTRRHRNPYREWIGAQIRCDGYAWACAGRPELAAELAWRDAHWTHERSGIHGAMLCAAMQAAAFVESEPLRLIEIGLSEIPRDCRLAQAVRTLIGIAASEPDWERCMDQIEALCATISPTHGHPVWSVPGMHPVHTINNALVVVLALLKGRDPQHAIALSVMCGLDTDCNGATVGSVMGAAAGARMHGSLSARLNDRVRPSMVGFADCTLSDLAKRHAAQWHRIDAWVRAGRR
jgi:ADP-ribosylglycohydrolase